MGFLQTIIRHKWHSCQNDLPAVRPHEGDIIAIAASGGMDSLCAMLMLKAQGYSVMAIHALLTENADVPAALPHVCEELHVPLHILDLRSEFNNLVIQPFLAAIANSLTPNPCVNCNKAIKFGLLRQAAFSLGADWLASGHYCCLKSYAHSPYATLAPARDHEKDQSYFLCLVEPEKLARVIFPLAHMRKSQARAMLENAGLKIPLPKESQDICFLENWNPGAWLTGLGCNCPPGDVVLRSSSDARTPLLDLPRVARHKGLIFYTPGQRRGLGIAWHEPVYVREKEPGHNLLVVAPRAMMSMRGCRVGEFNYLVPRDIWPARIFARLRYRQPAAPCEISEAGEKMRIILEEPLFTSAPGQFAAIYDDNGFLLGGGCIQKIIYES